MKPPEEVWLSGDTIAKGVSRILEIAKEYNFTLWFNGVLLFRARMPDEKND